MPFVKGQSGNPGGRRKASKSVVDAAKKHGVAAIEVLAKIMKDPKSPANTRVAAANTLLDRGSGRAASTINVRRLTDMTEGEIVEFLGRNPGADELRAVAGFATFSEIEGDGATDLDASPGEPAAGSSLQ